MSSSISNIHDPRLPHYLPPASPWAANAPERRRKTHTTFSIIQFFKSLSLKDRLEKNCAIERENGIRMQRKYAKLCAGQDAFDENDDAASMITIEEEEKALLTEPMMYDAYKDLMPKYLVLELVQRFTGRPLKRKADGFDCSRSGSEPPLKSMKSEPDVQSQAAEPKFTAALLLAESRQPLPITWYSNKALNIIRNRKALRGDAAAALEHWDVNEILASKDDTLVDAGMTSETCENFEQYTECAENHNQAYALLDSPGSTTYSDWAVAHHAFFTSRVDSIEMYEFWKQQEKQIRDARARTPSFDRPAYEEGYRQCQRDYDKDICILCAHRGHSVEEHDVFKHPKTLPDGKDYWARKKSTGSSNLFDRSLNKNVCMAFNRAGIRCDHGNWRLHCCSFCGSSGHHALSWTCRSRM
ncbi:hypothetical protein DFP72DRAFT_879434 [Ephemerocybe angulata]|uniref:Uncharacterized protein n=1 Tax=Ephemerocybe angulata TaxID=980116 RepID=A0A8H6MB05_9AGAR|nr:hypothetical protein DFP72DRAFT_879434 [Tulosesus angulatus]